VLNKLLFAKTIAPIAGKCLDAYSMRQKAIANNIANAEVSGYNRLEIDFEAELKDKVQRSSKWALHKTHPKHLPIGDPFTAEPKVKTDKSEPKYNAINNIDIDMEMTDLAKNQLNFSLISNVLRMEYQRMRMAIRGQ
jgi:flagellar basal-body rod protein FlgB